jgi:hypothetical protein
MYILQQKSAGDQYSLSHVFRMFIYYTADFSNSRNKTTANDDL